MGSIPAHTGEPRLQPRRHALEGVYPRAYGGTSSSRATLSAARGLSPRIRGNRSCRNCSPAPPGSIPAHTGEPHNDTNAAVSLGVYPRAYGGTIAVRLEPPRGQGLSPRIRGNPENRLEQFDADGSIPAHTGEPRAPRFAAPGRWVYPRAYGGTARAPLRCSRAMGLSPRIRGNHEVRAWQALRHGSIPAHTGEPSGRGRPIRG